MFVETYMSRPVVTVTADTLLPEVRRLLLANNFRHLPVVDRENRLVGIITDRDLRGAWPAALMSEAEKEEYGSRFARTSARAIMTEAVARIGAAATLDDALLQFDRAKVGALPVVDGEDRLVGILSIRDLLSAYRQLFGLGERGSSLISVRDDGGADFLTRLVLLLDQKNIPFTRLIKKSFSGHNQGVVYLRIHTHNLHGVHRTLKDAGFAAVVPGRQL